MSSCDGSSINKNYIVLPPTDVDVLSACTGFYTNNIYNCTGDTLTLHSTTVSANTINASVYLSGGTNLLDIFGSFDNYTTGATLVGSTAYFDRTDLLSAYTLNLSALTDNNTFVTGSTLSGNTLVLTRNDSVELSTDLSSIVPDSNLGNILFVAITGDDSTGTKGDIHKPYRNLYAAKSASTSGDTVYVFPGTWEYDNRTSAGNPYNGQVDTLVNLWKDGVTYYFVPDTKIIFYNQTVDGESMYLFNPGGTTGETCNVLGGLEYEQFSNGADTSNGANYFYFNDSGFDSTFYSETHKLTSHHCEIISVNMPSASFSASNTSVTIKSDYEYRDYLGGQTSSGAHYFFRSDYGVVNFVASSKYRDYRNAAYVFYFILSNANSTVHIYGETLKSESQIFLLRGSGDGNVATYNVGISDIYYGNGYTPFGYYGAVLSTYSKGGWTLNMNSNLYDLDPNSLTTGLFVTSNFGGSSDNNTINFKGNITTNTSSGVGRYIVDETSSGNTINIDGDITYLGSGTTTQILFQANGSDSVINYSGKISGNFASGIARPKNGGIININNSYIDSTVDGNTSSVFQNNTTVLGTGRLNNSYVRLTNNTNGVVDGEDNDIYINNSTIINLGTGSTVVYNTTDNGNLQIVNSVLISSYSGATSINYTGNTSVISSNTTVNTDYSASTINGNIITLTDLIY